MYILYIHRSNNVQYVNKSKFITIFLIAALTSIGECSHQSRFILIETSRISCRHHCIIEYSWCTAYAFNEQSDKQNCYIYQGSQKTKGDGTPGWTCYLMQGAFTLFIKVVRLNLILVCVSRFS